MSDRIYYTDPACRAFDATVTRSFDHEGRPAVALDRTAFYPTSGGQPFDTGRLNDTAVLDVVDLGEEVVHVLQQPIPEGTHVHGEIAWDRRFDHMQQHTGQHVLSNAFERVAMAATIGFHLGAEVSTIDLNREVDAASIARAEDEANAVVFADRPVAIRFVSQQEAAALPLRKEPSREGTLRLIEVPDFDLSACGGTHVASTGAIGLIAVLGWERFKGGSRVTFVCGRRALRSVRRLRDTVAGSVRLLSVSPDELPDAIGRLQAEARDQRKTLRTLSESLARHEGAAMLEGAATIGGVRVVVRVMQDRDAAALKSMAAAAIQAGTAAIGLLTATSPAQVVIARSADVSIDSAGLVRELIGRFGGKGGGSPELAQGGGLTGDVRAIEWALTGLLEDALSPPRSG